jgi:hypothetical protein
MSLPSGWHQGDFEHGKYFFCLIIRKQWYIDEKKSEKIVSAVKFSLITTKKR